MLIVFFYILYNIFQHFYSYMRIERIGAKIKIFKKYKYAKTKETSNMTVMKYHIF